MPDDLIPADKYYDAETDKRNRLAVKRKRLEALRFEDEGGNDAYHRVQRLLVIYLVLPGSPGWVRRQFTRLANFILFGLIRRTQVMNIHE